MKLKVYKTITPLLCAVLFIGAGSIASETSRLRIEFRGKSINLDNAVSAVAKKESGRWRIIIGARHNDIMFNFSGTIEGMMKKEGVTLDSSWHPVSMMMIQNGRVYSAAPTERLLRHGKVRYSRRGKDQGPAWKNMTRRDRLTRGRGLVRNRAAMGSRCTMQLIPVMSGSEIRALQGSFEGLLVRATNKRKRGRMKAFKIQGSFIVEVEK